MPHEDQRTARGRLGAMRNKAFDPHGAYPHFAGVITLPNGRSHQTSLWARKGEDGHSYIVGRMHPPIDKMLEKLADGENASPSKTKPSEIPQDFEALDPKPGELILLEYECTNCDVLHYRGYLNPGTGDDNDDEDDEEPRHKRARGR